MNSYQGKVFTDNIIEATWMPESSNRVSAPDVRRGERVNLYQYANADQYYWKPQGQDDYLRRLETITFAASATIDESTTSLTPDNSYYAEVSSHTKKVTLSMCKANGEVVAYLVQLDAGTGLLTITDDLGNKVLVNSADNLIHLANADGCELKLDKQNFSLTVPDSAVITVANKFTVSVGANVMEMTPAGTKWTTAQFDIV